MKKNKLVLALLSIVTIGLISCSSGHKVAGVNLDGDYVLNNISFSGIDSGGVKKEYFAKDTATIIHSVFLNTLVFDDAAPNCFEGSTWHLPFNGYGSYTISGNSNCGPGQRSINWSIRTVNGQSQFRFKVLNGAKAKKITDGYIMNIVNSTTSGFTATEDINVDGRPATVTFNFVRQ